jgi:hypothetical protein
MGKDVLWVVYRMTLHGKQEGVPYSAATGQPPPDRV